MKACKTDQIHRLLENLVGCKGYDAFAADIQKCLNAYTMCGLCQIRAEQWFDTMIAMEFSELQDYVDRYKAGWLNPFTGY